MKIEFMDLQKQYSKYKKEINNRIQKVLDHGQYIMGPEVEELELKLKEYTSSKYCISVSSGTDALLVSLMAIGIKPGDEVITTNFSFVSTVEVIVLLGAKPVFIDIEPDTCNLNAHKIEKKISSKTRAIIPVSLYGQTPDLEIINDIAKKNNIKVIEDAAQSFGALYKGKRSCNLTDIGCTSFFPSKPLGCYGDGGAVFTNDDKIAKAAREIRLHGQISRYNHTKVGLCARIDTLQSAILLAKLPFFETELKNRKKMASIYNDFFDLHDILRIKQKKDRESVYGQYTIRVSKDKRAIIQKKLSARGIPTSVHYPIPLPIQKPYKKFSCNDENYHALKASSEVLSLPIWTNLNQEKQEYILKEIKKIIVP